MTILSRKRCSRLFSPFSQHAEIQKLAWRVVGQHIIYPPVSSLQRGLAAGVFLVRGHLLRPPVDVGLPLFLRPGFPPAEERYFFPSSSSIRLRQTWYTLPPSGRTSPPNRLGGVPFQQVIVLVVAIEEKGRCKVACAASPDFSVSALLPSHTKPEIAQHNDEIALAGPAQLPVFEAVQFAGCRP